MVPISSKVLKSINQKYLLNRLNLACMNCVVCKLDSCMKCVSWLLRIAFNVAVVVDIVDKAPKIIIIRQPDTYTISKNRHNYRRI